MCAATHAQKSLQCTSFATNSTCKGGLCSKCTKEKGGVESQSGAIVSGLGKSFCMNYLNSAVRCGGFASGLRQEVFCASCSSVLNSISEDGKRMEKKAAAAENPSSSTQEFFCSDCSNQIAFDQNSNLASRCPTCHLATKTITAMPCKNLCAAYVACPNFRSGRQSHNFCDECMVNRPNMGVCRNACSKSLQCAGTNQNSTCKGQFCSTCTKDKAGIESQTGAIFSGVRKPFCKNYFNSAVRCGGFASGLKQEAFVLRAFHWSTVRQKMASVSCFVKMRPGKAILARML